MHCLYPVIIGTALSERLQPPQLPLQQVLCDAEQFQSAFEKWISQWHCLSRKKFNLDELTHNYSRSVNALHVCQLFSTFPQGLDDIGHFRYGYLHAAPYEMC